MKGGARGHRAGFGDASLLGLRLQSRLARPSPPPTLPPWPWLSCVLKPHPEASSSVTLMFVFSVYFGKRILRSAIRNVTWTWGRGVCKVYN